MARAHILSDLQKHSVYQQLALGRLNKEIAAYVKQEYDIDVTPQNFNNYRKHKKKIEAAYEEIKEHVQEHFPLTKLARRLAELEQHYKEADHIGDIDPKEYCKRFDAAGENDRFKMIVEMASTIRKSSEAKIRLKMEILKTVKDEVEPLKLEVTHKGTDDSTMPKLKNVPIDELKKMNEQYNKALLAAKV